ncbi:MAG: hypothetical protein KIT09_14760 [Bryobacteraceae bacterium]|nr:hypothetical protein [Bryobacteraceae bacterium]
MVSLRFMTLAFAACAAMAQNANELFEKAPPHVEAALRERVRAFYQAHVDGKFRAADAVVHEDSKEVFFGSKKEQIRGFEIIRLQYSDNFANATAVVAVDTDFLMPGFGKRQVKIPLTTLWKFEDGQWWWYVRSPEHGVDTPFGTMKPGAEQEDVLGRLANMPNVEAIRKQIAVSKTEVVLNGSEPGSDEVVIVNGMPGEVDLEFVCASVPGLEAKLDKERLAGGERATLRFTFQPPHKLAKDPVEGTLRIAQTAQVIPIRIAFTPPPDLQKAPPKP